MCNRSIYGNVSNEDGGLVKKWLIKSCQHVKSADVCYERSHMGLTEMTRGVYRYYSITFEFFNPPMHNCGLITRGVSGIIL